MTMEQVLEIIKRDHEETVFNNSEQLLNLFADYSKGKMKAEQNQLDIFLKCQGNTRILNLRSATKQTEQTEYARLLREMVNTYSMREQAAEKICGTFWRVVLGTEPPALANTPTPVSETGNGTASAQKESKSLPASKVTQSSGKNPAEQGLEQNTGSSQKKRASSISEQITPSAGKALKPLCFERRFRDLNFDEKFTFVMGLAGVLLSILSIICFSVFEKMPDDSIVLFVLIAFLGCRWLLTLWKLVRLWKKSYLNQHRNRFLAVILDISDAMKFPSFACGLLFIMVAFFGLFLPESGQIGFWPNVTFVSGFVGLGCCHTFAFFYYCVVEDLKIF